MSRLRSRWRWMACVQVILILAGSGWMLFTQHRPELPISSAHLMLCVLMLAGAGISISAGAFASGRNDDLEREEEVALAYLLQYSPIAGLLAWSVCMILFWQFLHGWDPGWAAFFVSNQFGLFVLCWVLGQVALRLVIFPIAGAVAVRRRERRM